MIIIITWIAAFFLNIPKSTAWKVSKCPYLEIFWSVFSYIWTEYEDLLYQYHWPFQKQPPQALYKKGILKKNTKFTGKCLCQSLFFNKFAGLRPAVLVKNRLAQLFSLWILRNFKNSFLQNILNRLLLSLSKLPQKIRKPVVL